MANGEDDTTVHIEKTDDEEEINARNEASIFINDHNNEFNRNKQVILKDKELSAKELLALAEKTLEKDFTTSTDRKTKNNSPGMN